MLTSYKTALGAAFAVPEKGRTVSMKVAIPVFGERVSPRFDCARAILLIHTGAGRIRGRQKLVTSDWKAQERINRLVKLGVEMVICGGIDRWSADALRSAGVTVRGCVFGEVENVLEGLIGENLPASP
jgi:predicted Fe-Mo cluster-binding NifX family protein